ncbi:cupredoxin domain-containing protein [Candidatus Daviesbacteria bacterium]|nr:cupredoxin domain-containing protein [Candidatus Daviesbacteria bacterium]
MNNKYILAVILVLVLIGGFWFINSRNQAAPISSPSVDTTSDDSATSESPSPASEAKGEVKEIMVENKGLTFIPPEIKVKKGDKVKLTFKVTIDSHDFRVDEFNAGTNILKVGEQETIEFVADKTGTFEYYCSVPGHRVAGMKGNLIVE